MKLNEEQIYHLIDLLEMDIENTPKKDLLDDNMKKDSVKYNKKLIKKLKAML